jgi:hypothetical protein
MATTPPSQKELDELAKQGIDPHLYYH